MANLNNKTLLVAALTLTLLCERGHRRARAEAPSSSSQATEVDTPGWMGPFNDSTTAEHPTADSDTSAAIRSLPSEHESLAPTPRRGVRDRVFSVAGSLAVVLGLLALTLMGLRSMHRYSDEALPVDVVEVLGRTTLMGNRDLHLVRVGGKLLLLSLEPSGIETVTEICDEAEVQRIVTMCTSRSQDRQRSVPAAYSPVPSVVDSSSPAA